MMSHSIGVVGMGFGGGNVGVISRRGVGWLVAVLCG